MTDKPKRKRAEQVEPGRSRQGKNLNVWIEGALRDAVDMAVEQSRPRTNLKGIVEVALQEYLKTVGLWPPSAES
jgi:hypothetical protein